MIVSASTRLFALLGDPVAHSRSPAMQNAAFHASGLDAVYVALRCDAEGAADLIRAISTAGGGGNVTIPHKHTAAQIVDVAEPIVQRTGACNTFWMEKARIRGDNTDVAGFRSAVRHLLGSTREIRGLLLGAGGAASAAACAIVDDGGRIDIISRSPDRARQLRARIDPEEAHSRLLPDIADAADVRYDLVINATPIGQTGDVVPIDLDRLRFPGAVFDMIVRDDGTTFVRSARDRGIPAINGSLMLLGQGAAAFERWYGREAPVDAMKAALGDML